MQITGCQYRLAILHAVGAYQTELGAAYGLPELIITASDLGIADAGNLISRIKHHGHGIKGSIITVFGLHGSVSSGIAEDDLGSCSLILRLKPGHL